MKKEELFNEWVGISIEINNNSTKLGVLNEQRQALIDEVNKKGKITPEIQEKINDVLTEFKILEFQTEDLKQKSNLLNYELLQLSMEEQIKEVQN